jgi:hypothetical protein
LLLCVEIHNGEHWQIESHNEDFEVGVVVVLISCKKGEVMVLTEASRIANLYFFNNLQS